MNARSQVSSFETFTWLRIGSPPGQRSRGGRGKKELVRLT
jgi:hypothetical protein